MPRPSGDGRNRMLFPAVSAGNSIRFAVRLILHHAGDRSDGYGGARFDGAVDQPQTDMG
jgi:hypothetical protein